MRQLLGFCVIYSQISCYRGVRTERNCVYHAGNRTVSHQSMILRDMSMSWCRSVVTRKLRVDLNLVRNQKVEWSAWPDTDCSSFVAVVFV